MQYNKKVDEIIVSVLLQNERMSYLKLKGEVEKIIYPKQDHRHLSKSVYKFHIDQLLKDKVLHKEDDGKRGKEVYYSLTKAAKKKRQLNLLGIDPKQTLFRQIYADLFFNSIIYSSFLNITDLDAFLSEISASRTDLKIVALDPANDIPYDYGYEGMDEDPFLLRIRLQSKKEWHNLAKTINLEPRISEKKKHRDPDDATRILYECKGFHIIEFHDLPVEVKEEAKSFLKKRSPHLLSGERLRWRLALIPGVTINDFSMNYFRSKYKQEDVEDAFDLLSKEGLIRPTVIFPGETRYIITDNILSELIKDLQRLRLRERQLLKTKWSYYIEPSLEEKERAKFLLREGSANEYFHRAKIMRNEFIQMEKQRPPNTDFLEAKKDLDKYFKKLEHEVQTSIENIKKKYGQTLQRYDFLHDVIRIVTPAVLQSK